MLLALSVEEILGFVDDEALLRHNVAEAKAILQAGEGWTPETRAAAAAARPPPPPIPALAADPPETKAGPSPPQKAATVGSNKQIRSDSDKPSDTGPEAPVDSPTADPAAAGSEPAAGARVLLNFGRQP